MPSRRALHTFKRGSAAGLSGASVELYKLLLDDAAALSPSQSMLRGIATGDVFRRLVSRAFVREFSGALEAATRPFQFALQTRAGTDSLAAMLRAALDSDPRATGETSA